MYEITRSILTMVLITGIAFLFCSVMNILQFATRVNMQVVKKTVKAETCL